MLAIFPAAVWDLGTIDVMVSQVAAFASRRWRVATEFLRVEVEMLHGGLELAVVRARLSHSEGYDTMPPTIVVKCLPRGFEREAHVYDVLWQHLERPPAVRLFRRERVAEATYLYMEDAQSSVPGRGRTRTVQGGLPRVFGDRLRALGCRDFPAEQ